VKVSISLAASRISHVSATVDTGAPAAATSTIHHFSLIITTCIANKQVQFAKPSSFSAPLTSAFQFQSRTTWCHQPRCRFQPCNKTVAFNAVYQHRQGKLPYLPVAMEIRTFGLRGGSAALLLQHASSALRLRYACIFFGILAPHGRKCCRAGTRRIVTAFRLGDCWRWLRLH
jgi:hypothetical protein